MNAEPKPLYRTRIREQRKAAGLTLKQVAVMVNTTPQTIQRIETDNMTVSMEWLERIAFALDVKVADLVGPAMQQPGDGFISALRMRYAADRREPMPDPEWYGLQLIEAAVSLGQDFAAARAGRMKQEGVMEQAVAVAAMAMRLALEIESRPKTYTEIVETLTRQEEPAL